MPHYYKNMDIAEDTDSDVTWTMQEVVSETVDYNYNGRQPKEPVGYRYMTEENKIKKKKKKKKLREDRDRRRPKSAEVRRTKKVEANKDLGYGLGLSRGFSLWRTLKDMRHCITKVSNPLTKAQRRSLRRKLSYYVDDLERIVVGVNPRAPVTEAEESISGDEEMREEVTALIEDALDEAALQGKIVQSGYFETRMSYLEQQCATLKKRLEEVADQKSAHHEAASMTLLEHQERRKTIGPKKGNVEVQEEEGECQERHQMNKQEVADQKSAHQEAASKTLLEHQGKRKAIGSKKRKVVVQDEEGECQERQQMNKQEVLKKSSTLYSSLCNLQAAAMSRRLNDGSVESHREDDGGNEVLVEREERTAHGKERNQKQMEKELTQALRQEEETSENEEDIASKIQADVPVRLGNKSFKGWDSECGPSSKGGRKDKHVPNILKRISLEY